MSSSAHTVPRKIPSSNPKAMLKLAGLQAFFTLVFSLGLWFCFDLREALSALFGGLVAASMTFFMAWRLFASHRISKLRAVEPGETLIRFYISAVLKIVFTLAMMVMFIVVIEVSILPFILAYLVAAILVNMLFLLWDANANSRNEEKEQHAA